MYYKSITSENGSSLQQKKIYTCICEKLTKVDIGGGGGGSLKLISTIILQKAGEKKRGEEKILLRYRPPFLG